MLNEYRSPTPDQLTQLEQAEDLSMSGRGIYQN